MSIHSLTQGQSAMSQNCVTFDGTAPLNKMYASYAANDSKPYPDGSDDALNMLNQAKTNRKRSVSVGGATHTKPTEATDALRPARQHQMLDCQPCVCAAALLCYSSSVFV